MTAGWLWGRILCLLACLTIAVAQQVQAAPACTAVITAIATAPGDSPDGTRPATGWEAVTVPDVWPLRWPDHVGPVWYRVDWDSDCTGDSSLASQSLGLGIDGIGLAGEVYVNDELLWRDRSLVEPMTLSWNSPRWWLVPQSALRRAGNTIWIRTVGSAEMASGLGKIRLGPADEVEAAYANSLWRQRTVHFLSIGLSGGLGVIFLAVWFFRRAEQAFGWYAVMSFCWVLYLGSLLATSPWPMLDVSSYSRLNNVAFVLYVFSFCLFTWRFGAQHLPRTEVLLKVWVAASLLTSVLAPRAVVEWVWISATLVFMVNCAQFPWHAWRTRERHHIMLALCWLSFLVIGAHDFITVIRGWQADEAWAAVTAPIAAVCMAWLLGERLASSMQRIDRFNLELKEGVASAQAELADVLAREHAQALSHAALRERLRIVHDLHDGLGGSLVRSLALVEQAGSPLSNERMLSLLKTLRDDLRQVIEQGAGETASIPATPLQWMAPLRHRFARLLEEIGVTSEWMMDTHWRRPPTALQCLGLSRLMEEALSNIIKHSRAQRVRIVCRQDTAEQLCLSIEDDGVGFDLQAVHDEGLSVGVRSMIARASRLGGQCRIVQRQPHGTVVSVTLAPAGACDAANLS